MAAMANGRSRVRGCLESEDTEIMRACLAQLGVPVKAVGDAQDQGLTDFEVDGQGRGLGFANWVPKPLYVGTAGTVARFLTAALAATGAPVDVDGSARMRERPMDTLVDALRQLGAKIECSGKEGALPMRLYGGPKETGELNVPALPPLRGGQLEFDKLASSQFISALVYAGLYAREGLTLVLRAGTPARPYVDMTLAALHAFGGRAHWQEENVLRIEPTELRPCDYVVEPDASSASYFLALAAIWGGRVTIPDLGSSSLQGDAGFYRVLTAMGARGEQDAHSTTIEGSGRVHGAQLDLTQMPDMTLTAAVVALFADGPTSIRGVEILRHHECDRLAAAATELRKLGAQVVEHEDGLDIVPPGVSPNPIASIVRGIEIDTYDDHRVAMAFAMVGDVIIRDPHVTGKTFPRYFEVLAGLGMVDDSATT
jgi:3-phosphoshikimate 1-carboxyvinyltransferase